MKKIYLVISLIVAHVSMAQPLLYDGFNYTPSATNGINVQSSGAWANVNTGDSILVTANSLTYAGLAASIGNKVAFDGAGVDNYRFFNPQTTGTVYASCILNVSSLGTMNATGTYVLNFIEPASVSAYGGCLWLKASATAGKYLIGISNRSSVSPITYTTVDMNLNESYFIVFSYEIIAGLANDVTRMWINTTQFGGTAPVSTLTATGGTDLGVAGIGRILLRQPGTTLPAPFVEFDEIRVGTTWADVTPCASPSSYYQDLDGDTFGNPTSLVLSCMSMPGLVTNNLDCNDNNATINPNTIWYADTDGDGFGNLSVTQTGCVQPTGFVSNSTDCNDNNAAVNAVTTWYQDSDGDGYGNLAVTLQNCGQPVGYVVNSTDCNDASAAVNPGVVEVFNAIDDNCNNIIDEGFTSYYLDNDGDGVGGATFVVNVTSPGPNYTLTTGDCNDNNPNVFPGNTEICDNLDNDCDQLIDEGLTFVSYYQDSDADGFGNLSVTQTGCVQPTGFVSNSTDCNDNNAAVNAVATWYQDSDGDGYGNLAVTLQNCGQPAGYVANSTDCNDASAAVNPGAIEVYNGIDDNCNNIIDEGFTPVNYYLDNDGDGVGGATFVFNVTSPGPNYTLTTGDCNDNNSNIFPGNTEICDNIDNDCDQLIDEGLTFVSYYQDLDGDSYGNASVMVSTCTPPLGYVLNSTDCNDASAAVNPGAVEVYNGIDDNCNNTVDEGFSPVNYYLDNDGDGVGGATFVVNVTSPGPNYTLTTGDCNDNNPNIFPGNTEICDNLDNDCDLLIDEGLTFVSYYQDLDGDSYGNASVMLSSCTPPLGYVLNSTDCQDNAATINPAAFDIPGNGIDEDCSGLDAPIVPLILGLYEFVGTVDCATQDNAVTTQPTSATFSLFSGTGTNCSAGGGVFNRSGWNTSTTVDVNQYNEFSVNAANCQSLNLDRVAFKFRPSASAGSPVWHLRSSVDNFATDLDFGTGINVSNSYLDDTVYLTNHTNLSQVIFRFYVTEMLGTTTTWRMDDVSLYGNILAVTPQTFYQDSDGDGFGNANNTLLSCTLPLGYTSNNTDCNDNDSLINPLTTWYVDADLDGFGNPNNFVTSCIQPAGTSFNGLDCDDSNAQLNLVVMYYVDADTDGFGDDATGVEQCAQPANTVTIGGDCDDADSTVYPGAIELCDGLDNNCNNNIDEGLPTTTYYEDLDGDTYGSSVVITTCETLGNGFVLITGDCDDNNPNAYPGAMDVLDNGIDENCDGVDNYLAIDEQSLKSVVLMPNPAQSVVQIIPPTNFNGLVEVMDLKGTVVYRSIFATDVINLSVESWSRGLYLVRLSAVNYAQVLKLVVE